MRSVVSLSPPSRKGGSAIPNYVSNTFQCLLLLLLTHYSAISGHLALAADVAPES